ncbi:hypothetical protein [Serratia liquefaciens]|uniref:hypothetical protein n=1 Tax=Serratia liquefaciens TaxID=614 RepID=UPI0022DD0736|nr:hypothetical protein [Serratia liquefaciens]WBL72407.1 hypothetical protein LQ945_23045 [Serratia liquefaciens]
MLNDYFFDFSSSDFLFFTPLKEDSSFLPITVIFAIGLFFLKEVFEFVKKHKANNRKIFAMKRLFSRECEKNLWTVKILRRVLSEINEEYENGKEVKLKFSEHEQGYVYIYKDDGSMSGLSITKTRRELMDKNLMEAAVSSEALFKKLEGACDALAELEHIRDSFLNIENSSKEFGNPLLAGFLGYALEEILTIQQSLNDLYKYCTGNELENARLR